MFCCDALPEVSQERCPHRASTNHHRLASRTSAAPRPPRALGIPSPAELPTAGSPSRSPGLRARGPAEGSPGESGPGGRDRALGRLRARPRTAGCRPLPSAPARPRGAAGGARAEARRGGRGSKSPSRARRRGSGCQQRRGSDSSEPEAARKARRGAGDAAAGEDSAAAGFCLRLAARSFFQRRPRGCGTATLRPSAPGGRKRRAAGSRRPPLPAQRRRRGPLREQRAPAADARATPPRCCRGLDCAANGKRGRGGDG